MPVSPHVSCSYLKDSCSLISNKVTNSKYNESVDKSIQNIREDISPNSTHISGINRNNDDTCRNSFENTPSININLETTEKVIFISNKDSNKNDQNSSANKSNFDSPRNEMNTEKLVKQHCQQNSNSMIQSFEVESHRITQGSSKNGVNKINQDVTNNTLSTNTNDNQNFSMANSTFPEDRSKNNRVSSGIIISDSASENNNKSEEVFHIGNHQNLTDSLSKNKNCQDKIVDGFNFDANINHSTVGEMMNLCSSESATNTKNGSFNQHHMSQQNSVSDLNTDKNKNIQNFNSERFCHNGQQTSELNVSSNTKKNVLNQNSDMFGYQNSDIISHKKIASSKSGSFHFNENNQQNLNKNSHIVEYKLTQNPGTNNYHKPDLKSNSSINTNINSKPDVQSSENNCRIKNHDSVTSSNQPTISKTQKQVDISFHLTDQNQHTGQSQQSCKVNGNTASSNNESNLNEISQNTQLVPTVSSSNIPSQNSGSHNFPRTNANNNKPIPNSCENSNFRTEIVKTSVSQNSKSTQVNSLQLSFNNMDTNLSNNKTHHTSQHNVGIDNTKSANTKLSVCENKSLLQDDSQELSSLFPTDTKLPSCSENLFRDTDFRDRSLFLPVSHSYMDEIRLTLPHSDFSNDLFSSLQVPAAGQHPESISPTAAFLLAFPLVSTSKTSELIAENEGGDSQHATPTTILQIGNIDPPSNELFQQTALMIENNVNKLQGTMKQNKPEDSNKNNNGKQLKEIENFSKFQQIEINELIGNESFSRNNCKEKKNIEFQEQDLYLTCTKKKSSGRNNSYQMPSQAVPNFQEKPYEYSQNNASQERQITRNEQKKSQGSGENILNNSQTTFSSSSQPYSYNSFSNGNEFMLSNSNYQSTSLPRNDNSKPSSLPSSNLNVISWTTSSVTVMSNHPDYTTAYSNYHQKQFTTSNKSALQKNNVNNFEDQRLKEKPTSSNSCTLPKFSNFQFNNNTPDVHIYTQNQTDNMSYKVDSKVKKQKTTSHRPPVNWMTTPDVRPIVPEPGIAPLLPEVMFQHQKDLDFTASQNNMMTLNTSNNITPFTISSTVPNNPQPYYPNSHFSGVDLQLDFAPFPEISSNKPQRNITSVANNQQNPHHYSWSPSKSSIPLLPHIDSHMIPSTLPTLVGDLALGTTTPSGPVDTLRTLSMPTTPFNIETSVKKFDSKHESEKSASKSSEKECFPTDRRNSRTAPDYCQKSHSHQGTNTTSSFLSVSQLVDQVKSEQSSSSRRTTKQSMTSKNSSGQKRNANQHNDKSHHPKMSNNLTTHNNYNHPNPVNPVSVSQRKGDVQLGSYQDINNPSLSFPGTFGNHSGPPSWQNDKNHRLTSHYKGNYSAESLIADQNIQSQDHITELSHFNNQYNHTPVVSSASYPSAEYPHQNIQPLEFHQSQQNCFNFPTHNSHYSATPFNQDGDYHIGLDPMYNFNHTSSKNSTCQTSSKDGRGGNKRSQGSKRREDFASQWTPQVYSTSARAKVPPSLPPPVPVPCSSTSSPAHQSSTTLTNFNLSTIFPEINDKRNVPGPLSFHSNKVGDSAMRPSARPDYTVTDYPAGHPSQVGSHFPAVSLGSSNFRPAQH